MVQSVDDGEEFGFGRFGGHADFIRADARALAGADLVADVDLAGGILAHEDDGESGTVPVFGACLDAGLEFVLDACGKCLAVNDLGCH